MGGRLLGTRAPGTEATPGPPPSPHGALPSPPPRSPPALLRGPGHPPRACNAADPVAALPPPAAADAAGRRRVGPVLLSLQVGPGAGGRQDYIRMAAARDRPQCRVEGWVGDS